MKSILSILVLTFTAIAFAGPHHRTPTSVTDKDTRYFCKHPVANVQVVANVTDGTINVYEDDKDLANGIPKKIGGLEGLEVRKVENLRSSAGTKKTEISYTFYKEYKGDRLTTTRPVFEIEMEKDMDSGFIAHADGKAMGVFALDYDIEDMNCKRKKKDE